MGLCRITSDGSFKFHHDTSLVSKQFTVVLIVKIFADIDSLTTMQCFLPCCSVLRANCAFLLYVMQSMVYFTRKHKLQLSLCQKGRNLVFGAFDIAG